MNNVEFSSILNESQKQFTTLLQDGKVGNSIKKATKAAANTVGKGAKFVSAGAKAAGAAGISLVKDKLAAKAKDKLTSDKKGKSELDKLDTVSKSSDKPSKVKEGVKKVASETKKVATDPIKASTAVGVALGGAAGGALGFGVGSMVKDIADGVKQVKGKLMENNQFESLLLESQNSFTQLFENKDTKFESAYDKMDKWMPSDEEIQDEFYEIKTVKEMSDFIELYGDQDTLASKYKITYSDLKKFSIFLLDKIK